MFKDITIFFFLHPIIVVLSCDTLMKQIYLDVTLFVSYYIYCTVLHKL